MAVILLFILIFVLLISIGYRVYRIIYFEKRIKGYCVTSSGDDISFMDKVEDRYHQFLVKFQNNDNLQKKSKGYHKYVTLGDYENPVYFLLNKLFIGFVFTLLVVFSYVVNGKLVSFLGLVVSFIVGYYLYDIYLYLYYLKCYIDLYLIYYYFYNFYPF